MFRKLGRFEIKEIIGRGAMGEVYLGLDPALGREVAIKTILASGLPEDQARQRFDREAKAAAVLNHPNIVTIHELGEDQGVLFIAMERLKGLDLEQLLVQRSLTMPEYLEVLAQVCDGLDAAHRHHIIHRDIKPSNIMVVRDGRKLLVKIMDFGVARLKDSAMTVVGTVMGTVNYIAPEYIRNGEPDARSDLFAVGVMLYECLSGRKPFEGDSASTVLFKIVNDPPKPIDLSQLHGISPAVRGMLDTALAKDPADRYQTAEDFALALRAAKDPAWQGKIEESTIRMTIRPGLAQVPQPPLDSLIGQTVTGLTPAQQPMVPAAKPQATVASVPVKAGPPPTNRPATETGKTQLPGLPKPHAAKTEVIPPPKPLPPAEAKPAPIPEATKPPAATKDITQEVDVTPFQAPPLAKTEVIALPQPTPEAKPAPVPEAAKPPKATQEITQEVDVTPFQAPPLAKTEMITLPKPTPETKPAPVPEAAKPPTATQEITREVDVTPFQAPPSAKTEVITLPKPTSEAKPVPVPEAAKPPTATQEITREVDVTPFQAPPSAKTEVIALPKPTPEAKPAPVPEAAKSPTATQDITQEVDVTPFQAPPAAKTEMITLPKPTPPAEAKPALAAVPPIPEATKPPAATKDITQDVKATPPPLPLPAKPEVPAPPKPTPEAKPAPVAIPPIPVAMKAPAPIPAASDITPEDVVPVQVPPAAKTEVIAPPKPISPVEARPAPLERPSDASTVTASGASAPREPRPADEPKVVPTQSETTPKVPAIPEPAAGQARPARRLGLLAVVGTLILAAAIAGGIIFARSRSKTPAVAPPVPPPPMPPAPAPAPVPPPVVETPAAPEPPPPAPTAAAPKPPAKKAAPKPKPTPAPVAVPEPKPVEVAPPPPPPPPPPTPAPPPEAPKPAKRPPTAPRDHK